MPHFAESPRHEGTGNVPSPRPVGGAASHVRQQQGAAGCDVGSADVQSRETPSQRHHSWEWERLVPASFAACKRGLRIMWRRQGSACEYGSWTRSLCMYPGMPPPPSVPHVPSPVAGSSQLPVQRFSKLHSVMIECGHPHFASPSRSGQDPGRGVPWTGT